MPVRFHTADVFTDRMFGGNPLAVIPDATGLSEEQMRAITREFNFSETVFVFPPENPEHTRRVRIFTPGSELPFAGHPTVGTAFVLARTGEIPFAGGRERIILEEGVGPVPVVITGDTGAPSFAQLTAARLPETTPSPLGAAEIARLLSLEDDEVLDRDGIQPEVVSCGVPFLFAPIRDLPALGRAHIRSDAWAEVQKSNRQVPEIYLFTEDRWTSAGGSAPVAPGVVRARMFAPGMGISEDPATGGAAAALAGYLTARSDPGDSTLHWTIYQGVEMGRPSRIEIEAERHGGEISAVRVGGDSILVTSGTLHI